MGDKDFFDDDLIQRRDSVREVKMGPTADPQAGADIPRPEEVPLQELNLTPLTRRKEELNGQVATKMDELERLRTRQEALEREKKALEQLRSNQERYELGKREMIDHLEQAMISLEREENYHTQRVALLAESARRFKDMLGELRNINESAWPTDSSGYRDVLNRSVTLVDDLRKEYNKALARVEASRESKGATSGKEEQPLLYGDLAAESGARRGFGDWFKMGLAVSLPVLVMLGVLIAILAIVAWNQTQGGYR